MLKNKFYILFSILCVFTLNTFAQESLKSQEEEYYDFLSLTGATSRPTLGYRTLSDSVWAVNEGYEDANLWSKNNLGTTFTLFEAEEKNKNFFTKGIKEAVTLKVYGPEWFNSYNTALPYGQNDGVLWQGVGYNTSLTGGARLEAYGFEVTFKPMVTFSQNLGFYFMPGVNGSAFSYFNPDHNTVDLVQRYGIDPYFQFDFGDSEIRYSWRKLTIGFGTQLPWLGPAYLNPMLGSNNAGSYPKLDVGLRKVKVNIPWTNWCLGEIEGRTWCGYLTESKYFDNVDTNNHNLIAMLNCSFAPSFIDGLTVGLNRLYLTRWKTKNFVYWPYVLLPKKINNWGEDVDGEDQKVSLYADWFFPTIGFEVYGEFGIDDFSVDYVSNPFSTGIYTLGFKKSFDFENKNLDGQLVMEFNNFEMSQNLQLVWSYLGFYAHSGIQQGYTQNGQILGAGSGQFGNSQYIAYKLYYPKGNTDLFFHRYCPNNNYIYSKAVYASASDNDGELYDWYANFETYMNFGVKTTYYVISDLSLGGELTGTWVHHRFYQWENDVFNFHIALKIKYQI